MKSDILNKSFKKGDIVEIRSARYGDQYVGKRYKATKVFRECSIGSTEEWVYGARLHCSRGTKGCYFANELTLIKMGKEFFMNEIIIEMFPKTKDAVLIDKWFGNKINNDPLTRLLIKGKEVDLLREAEKLENDGECEV